MERSPHTPPRPGGYWQRHSMSKEPGGSHKGYKTVKFNKCHAKLPVSILSFLTYLKICAQIFRCELNCGTILLVVAK